MGKSERDMTETNFEFEDLMAAAFRDMTAIRVRQYKRTMRAKEAIRDGEQTNIQDPFS